MKKYSVATRNLEETNKLLVALAKNGVKYEKKPGIVIYSFVDFRCEKDTWKAIKKELGLKVEHVCVRFGN